MILVMKIEKKTKTICSYLLGAEEPEKSGTGGFPSFDLRADLRGYLSFELIEFPILRIFPRRSKSEQKIYGELKREIDNRREGIEDQITRSDRAHAFLRRFFH